MKIIIGTIEKNIEDNYGCYIEQSMPDDVNIDDFIEKLQEAVDIIWGKDRIIIMEYENE